MPLRILKNLEEQAEKLSYIEKTKDAPQVRERCEYTLRIFQTMCDQIREAAPNFEQEKGARKGFEVSAQVVLQHKEILRQKCLKEEIDKEEFADYAELVDRIARSVRDAIDKQRDNVNRAAGKIDGLASGAQAALGKVQQYLDNLDKQRRFMEDDPVMANREYSHADGNGERPKKKRARRKPAAKKPVEAN